MRVKQVMKNRDCVEQLLFLVFFCGILFFIAISFFEVVFGQTWTKFTPITYVILYSVYGGLSLLFFLYQVVKHGDPLRVVHSDKSVQSKIKVCACVCLLLVVSFTHCVSQLEREVKRHLRAGWPMGLMNAAGGALGAFLLGMYFQNYGNAAPSSITPALSAITAEMKWGISHGVLLAYWFITAVVTAHGILEYSAGPPVRLSPQATDEVVDATEKHTSDDDDDEHSSSDEDEQV